MNDDQNLDALLDQALANYVDAEPDPSLRARITARIAETSPRRLWIWLPLAVGAAAATILTALLLYPAAPSRQTQMTLASPAAPAAPSVTGSTLQAAEAIPRRTAFSHHRRGRTAPPAVARSNTFPSPAPLTADESLLLRFAAEHPEQARRVLAATAADSASLKTPSLQIAPISIAALSDAHEAQRRQ